MAILDPSTMRMGVEMTLPGSTKRPWPAGYRLVLWAVGVALVLTVTVAALFLLNAPR